MHARTAVGKMHWPSDDALFLAVGVKLLASFFFDGKKLLASSV